MKDYKKLWESHYGPIPFDDEGRKFHIHHKDGNKKNNKIDNLMCLSPQAHYDIHYEQGDYFACQLIAKNHLCMSRQELIDLAKKSGELHKNTVTVKDNAGNYLRVSLLDPRYINGELTGATKGLVMARCIITGECMQITKDEFNEGKLAGLLVGTTSGNTLSEEHKNKCGVANTGKVRSPEHKQNYSESRLGRRSIIHKITGERRFAYNERKYPHYIIHSDITDVSEWIYGPHPRKKQ